LRPDVQGLNSRVSVLRLKRRYHTNPQTLQVLAWPWRTFSVSARAR
jgi:hypothetical protein